MNCPQCELIQLNKAAEEPHSSEEHIDYKTMEYGFMILEVKGTVKYKHLTGDNPKSVLELQRVDKDTRRAVGTLQLGELVGACDNVKTQQFDFGYCKDKSLWTSNGLLCQPGEKGVVCCFINIPGGLFDVKD